MSVAKIIEVTTSSPKSVEDAVRTGLKKVAETVKNIKGAWVNETKVVTDGEGNVTARFHQMLSIYAAFNGDFIASGFDDYMGIDYIGSFDKRFPSLDDEARANLYAMLSQAGDVPGNLLNEAKALLERLGIEPAADRIEIAR